MAKTDCSHDSTRPLIFGEVLYDCFPDGRKVLGGAPFNVAWHLQGFGLSPLFLTCIGDDANGHGALQQMADWGMDTRAVQKSAVYPTGTVAITWHGDYHRFHIAPDQAYDHIDREKARMALSDDNLSLLYHGTLAARSAASCDTLHWLRHELHLPTFIDINLRAPWWRAEEVRALIQDADWLKLNDDELREFVTGTTEAECAARQLARQHHITHLLVTMGADGALLLHGDQHHWSAAAKVDRLVDTVGAGDAFSAVIMLGLTRRWHAQKMLRSATEFAAAICMQRGATVSDPIFYEEFINRWED